MIAKLPKIQIFFVLAIRSREASVCSFDPHLRDILQRGAFLHTQHHVQGVGGFLAVPVVGRRERRATFAHIEVAPGISGRRSRTISVSPPVGALWMGV